MKKLLTLITLLCLYFCANAQIQSFGKVDTADLKLASCDFEKGAPAMVLFDHTDINTGNGSTEVLRHKRIKILNEAGKSQADVHIEYYSAHGFESISNIQAETINLENHTIEFVKVDPTAIYRTTVDRTTKKISFTFPKAKVGSIIEYSYDLNLGVGGAFPDWNFQGDLPVRYCEFDAAVRDDYAYKMTPRVYQPYEKDTVEVWFKREGHAIGHKYTWALKNINSYIEEPFSTCMEDDIQRLSFRLSGYKDTYYREMQSLESSWFVKTNSMLKDIDFGLQLNLNINDTAVINHVKTLKTDEEKISYLFGKIKNDMKWNGVDRWYTEDGIKKAWNKKQGNSTEINLVLYSFLKGAGIKCYPEVVSTRENGRIDVNYPNLSQFNKTVIRVPLAHNKYYVLDATDKYNNYRDIPFDVLNSNGLTLITDSGRYDISYLTNDQPSKKVVLVNAEIKPDGKIIGTAQINSFSYYKQDALQFYKKQGEEKYKDQLRDDDNNLKITSFKLENMEVDSLPLTQSIDFGLELTGSDEHYIYFNPNLFTGLNTNPFINEQRLADINFKFLRNYNINGRYKIPDGFKIEALPKGVNLIMPDTSITFKRIVAEQDGYVMVRYVINYKKSYYPKDDYPALRAFYKKMHEFLNEQIILKKS